LISISDSHDIIINASNWSSVIVLLHLLLSMESFEKLRSVFRGGASQWQGYSDLKLSI